jgi:hypothetical protein
MSKKTKLAVTLRPEAQRHPEPNPVPENGKGKKRLDPTTDLVQRPPNRPKGKS